MLTACCVLTAALVAGLAAWTHAREAPAAPDDPDPRP